MLGRLTFISTSLSDLTAHHFAHFLVYTYIMNPCSCLFYFHLALYSEPFSLASNSLQMSWVLTSPNIHYFQREYLQYCDSAFFVRLFFTTSTLFWQNRTGSVFHYSRLPQTVTADELRWYYMTTQEGKDKIIQRCQHYNKQNDLVIQTRFRLQRYSER